MLQRKMEYGFELRSAHSADSPQLKRYDSDAQGQHDFQTRAKPYVRHCKIPATALT